VIGGPRFEPATWKHLSTGSGLEVAFQFPSVSKTSRSSAAKAVESFVSGRQREAGRERKLVVVRLTHGSAAAASETIHGRLKLKVGPPAGTLAWTHAPAAWARIAPMPRSFAPITKAAIDPRPPGTAVRRTRILQTRERGLQLRLRLSQRVDCWSPNSVGGGPRFAGQFRHERPGHGLEHGEQSRSDTPRRGRWATGTSCLSGVVCLRNVFAEGAWPPH